MGLKYKDFEDIVCAHCGEKFRVYPKGPDKTGPEDVPWVTGGIISILGEDGSETHYHGYFNQPKCCYRQAFPSG